MSHKNPNGPTNLAFFEQALEGFAGEYSIDIKVFGDLRLHWRLSGLGCTLDCWPTTGKYWIKDMPIGCKEWRKGTLPHDYTKLDEFLKGLFNVHIRDVGRN
jgi:hypothetical protein